MILRELLENKESIVSIAEKYDLHPNLIHNWKKHLFENGSELFANMREKNKSRGDEKINRLEEKLKVKENVISEIVEDNIRLKKTEWGILNGQ